MGANEKIWQWDDRRVFARTLLAANLIVNIRSSAELGSCSRNVEYLHTPSANPISDRGGIGITNAQFG
jgi:hypothetical protein